MKNSIKTKKLTATNMENIVGGGQGRKCFLLGILTFASIITLPTFLGASMYTVAECA